MASLPTSIPTLPSQRPPSSSPSLSSLLQTQIAPAEPHFSLPSFTTRASHNHHKCFLFTHFTRTYMQKTVFSSAKRVLYCSNITNLSTSNLFDEMCGFFSLFQRIGIGERETEWLFNNNPLLKFVSVEALHRRILSLQSVGIEEFEVSKLILKCPDILTSDEIDGLIVFLCNELEGKIDSKQMQCLLITTEPRLLVGFDKKVRLLINHGIPKEKIAHILNNVNLNKAVCLKSVEEIKEKIAFLSRFGGVDLIVHQPRLLNYDLGTQLIPRIEVLLELSGGDEKATGDVLRKLPAVLSYSVGHLESHVEFFRSYAGFADPEIFKLVLVFPNVFSASRKRKLLPRVEFLKQCGLNSDEIFKFLVKAPLFLALSFENLSCKLVFLVKIGYKYRTKELVTAMGAVTRTSCENLQKMIGLLLTYGFSCEDIMVMSKKHPQMLQYSHSSLEKKIDYLVGEIGRELGELLAFPAFLGYKLDDRIKHRYEVKRRTIGEGMSLNKLLSVSSERFSTKNKKKNLNSLANNRSASDS
ncbi:Transcription termination factor, mitochondrial/chloroplastic [Dillenia turbinata]|uniref:Transcription termination factor, mitochondrial/chloroplastic n=1 Tax=Dillenia turbinata TaxID=194707 RepID=A0AAN8ZFZ4_9MAGN